MMKKEKYSSPEAEAMDLGTEGFLMINPSGGNIENPGDGGEDWEW